MARIIDSNHFAEGWQNKKATEKVADNIRHAGLEQSAINRTAANKVMEGIAHSKNIDASNASAVKVQDNNRAHAPVEKQIANSQTAQASRPEVQTEGAKIQAQEQYQKLKGENKVLEQLLRSNSRNTGPQEHVPRATQATQASISQNQQNQQNAAASTLSQATNGVPQPRANADAASKNVDPRKLVDDPSRTRQGAERPDTQKLTQQGNAATPEGPQITAQAAQASITPNNQRGDTARREAGEEPRVSTGRKGPQTAKSGVYKAGAGSTTDDMHRVYGGASSFAGDGSADAETREGEVSAASTIPMEDSLNFYNEIDSDKPGLETVLRKRNILERHVIKSVVEKRLMEIRDVDEQAGARIQDAFAVRPLRERIMGDIEVDLGNFYRGLYNGGISG